MARVALVHPLRADGASAPRPAPTLELLERYVGYTRGELIGQCQELLVPEQLRDRHRDHRASYMRDTSEGNQQVGAGDHRRQGGPGSRFEVRRAEVPRVVPVEASDACEVNVPAVAADRQRRRLAAARCCGLNTSARGADPDRRFVASVRAVDPEQSTVLRHAKRSRRATEFESRTVPRPRCTS